MFGLSFCYWPTGSGIIGKKLSYRSLAGTPEVLIAPCGAPL